MKVEIEKLITDPSVTIYILYASSIHTIALARYGTDAEGIGIARRSELDINNPLLGKFIAVRRAVKSLYKKLHPEDKSVKTHAYKRL